MSDDKDYDACIQHIRNSLNKRELLEQLAEECAEVGQASLKLIRAKGLSNNYTPKTAQEAESSLQEEIQDVITVLFLLNKLPFYSEIATNPKLFRWAKRLGWKRSDEVVCER